MRTLPASLNFCGGCRPAARDPRRPAGARDPVVRNRPARPSPLPLGAPARTDMLLIRGNHDAPRRRPARGMESPRRELSHATKPCSARSPSHDPLAYADRPILCGPYTWGVGLAGTDHGRCVPRASGSRRHFALLLAFGSFTGCRTAWRPGSTDRVFAGGWRERSSR